MMESNINGSKLMFHPERVAGDHRPITTDVFLNNYCNNNCPYCVYHRWELDKGAYAMTRDEFVRYATRLKELGVLGFILTGGGEPMITPDFEAIAAWLEENHLHYGVNTNLNVLKYCAPDYIKVSLDGWDEDSYEACRGVRAYRKVRENIIQYDAWRKKNAPLTSLGVQKVVARFEDILPFYEANKDLPFDYMALRPMESTAGSFYASEEAKGNAKKCIALIQAIAEKDKRVVLNFKWRMIEDFCSSCLAHWAQIAMNEKGNIMHCCHKPYQIIGHVMDEDILEKHAAAKTDKSTCDVPCRLTAPNGYLKMLAQGTKDPFFI